MWFIALVGCTAVQVADTPLDLLADPTATVSFDVDRADSIALLLRGDAFLAVDRVTGPDGEELWWEDWLGEEQLTQAVTAQEGETVLVWPVSPGSWSIDVHAFDAAGADAGPTPLTGLLQQKQGTGRALALTVRLSEGVELPEGTLDRLERTLRNLGLRPTVAVEAAGLPAIAPSLSDDPGILAQASDAQGLVVWVAAEVTGVATLGRAGNIPGHPLPGPRALVVLGVDAFAGTDGEFSEAEVNAFGDGIAHEVGHFLGLFHPVELSFDTWDALADTPRCSELRACEDQLGDNLMFPYQAGESVPRSTPDQRNVIRRHPSVR